MQHLIPAFHDLVVRGHQLVDAPGEVRLQRGIVFEVMAPHELLDARVGVPLLAIALVAADVEVGIGKQRRHLAQELVEKRKRRLARGIHRRVKDAPLLLDLVRTRPAGQLRVAYEPGCRVAGHVELGHHANAAVVRVGNHVANLLLRVEAAVRALFLQQRKLFALHREALVFRKVQVQHVELDGFHAVQVAFEHLDGLEVAAGIEHQAAPGEARLVVNGDGRGRKSLRRDVHQLQQRL